MGMRHGAFLALTLLTACVTTPDTAQDISNVNRAWTLRQQTLGAVQGFEALGRIAVKGSGLSGSLRWQQDGEHFTLRVAGPFGAGALSVRGTPAEVAIKGKDIDLITTEPAKVLAERTGWRLPLDSLRWWALGLPAPQAQAQAQAQAHIVLDDKGRAEQITQADWVLRYSDYRSDTAPALPHRIEVSQGAWSATLVLEHLTLVP